MIDVVRKCVKDTIGAKFNRLLVLEYAGKSEKGVSQLKCLCDCGKIVVKAYSSVKSGGTKSCGCYRVNNPNFPANKTHNACRTAEYNSWMNMKSRCYKKYNDDYHNYGGRGIKVCDEWVSDFSKFLEDMGPKPSSKHSLDRIDPNDHYSKGNCRWATNIEQARNRTRRYDNTTGEVGITKTFTKKGDTVYKVRVTNREGRVSKSFNSKYYESEAETLSVAKAWRDGNIAKVNADPSEYKYSEFNGVDKYGV